jgi:hypothetical protein
VLPDDTQVLFAYEIVGTNVAVQGYVKVPFAGHNSETAGTYQDGKLVRDAPYLITGTLGGGQNANMGFTIGPKPEEVVTDPKRVAELALHCAHNQDGCTYTSNSGIVDVVGQNKRTSDWFNNCSPTQLITQKTHWETTTTIENAFSFKVSAETGKLLEAFAKVSAEAQYSHKWSTSTKYAFDLELKVPALKKAAWFFAAGFDRISGQFRVYGADKTYILPNATILLPTTRGTTTAVEQPYDQKFCNPGHTGIVQEQGGPPLK